MVSLRLLVDFMALWCTSQALNNALFFDWREKKLVEMSKFDENAVCQSCLSACPVTDLKKQELGLIDDGVALIGNVILLRDIYPTSTTAGEMKIEICEMPLTPTLVWDTDVKLFQAGYEMYYEEGQVDLKTSKYDHYVKVFEGKPSSEPIETPSEDKIKIYKEADNTKFEIVEHGKKFVFYFINVLSFDVFNEGKTRAVTFVRDTINDYRHQIHTISYCKTYFSEDPTKIIGVKQETVLENEPSTKHARSDSNPPPEKDTDSIGEKEETDVVNEPPTKHARSDSYLIPQKETDLKGKKQETDPVNEPPTEDAQSDSSVVPEKETALIGEKQETDAPIQTLENEPLAKDAQPGSKVLSEEPESSTRQSKNFANRLIKTQILPMRMFHTLAARLATCMYLNIAFIWEPIAYGQLRKIDLFLYALYRLFSTQIKLSFAVSGELRGIEPNVQKDIATEHSLFTKYPVPKLIYRFVEVKWTDKFYGAIVIIHNSFESVPDADRICPENEEVEGWHDIRNENVAIGYSYVCEQTHKVYRKLRIAEAALPQEMLPLKLNNFPHTSGQNGPIEFKSAIERIAQELNYIKERQIEY